MDVCFLETMLFGLMTAELNLSVETGVSVITQRITKWEAVFRTASVIACSLQNASFRPSHFVAW